MTVNSDEIDKAESVLLIGKEITSRDRRITERMIRALRQLQADNQRLVAENEALKVRSGREFKMLDGPNVPWVIGEIFYAGYYAYGSGGADQSMEKVHRRGGIAWGEVRMFAQKDKTWDAMLKAIDAALQQERIDVE